MYLVGREHPNRVDLEAFVRENVGESYVTSAEVYQEVIHRFVAIDCRPAIDDCFRLLDALVDNVFAVERRDALRARDVVNQQPRLSARDALHLAVMERHGVDRVLTCDTGFDYWPSIVRVP